MTRRVVSDMTIVRVRHDDGAPSSRVVFRRDRANDAVYRPRVLTDAEAPRRPRRPNG